MNVVNNCLFVCFDFVIIGSLFNVWLFLFISCISLFYYCMVCLLVMNWLIFFLLIELFFLLGWFLFLVFVWLFDLSVGVVLVMGVVMVLECGEYWWCILLWVVFMGSGVRGMEVICLYFWYGCVYIGWSGMCI